MKINLNNKMKKIMLLIGLIVFSINSFSQSDLTNYKVNLSFYNIYDVDLDTNKWTFIANQRTDIIIDLIEDGSGRIILYFNDKKIIYVKENYVVKRDNGNRVYFFTTLNGSKLRLGVDSNNKISAFSIEKENNTMITFCNF